MTKATSYMKVVAMTKNITFHKLSLIGRFSRTSFLLMMWTTFKAVLYNFSFSSRKSMQVSWLSIDVLMDASRDRANRVPLRSRRRASCAKARCCCSSWDPRRGSLPRWPGVESGFKKALIIDGWPFRSLLAKKYVQIWIEALIWSWR